MIPHELTNLGLSEKEAQVFFAVLNGSPSGETAASTAGKLNFDTKRTHSHLKNLCRKGFIKKIKRGGNKIRFFPQHPKYFQTDIQNMKQEVAIKEEIVSKLMNMYYRNRLIKSYIVEGKEEIEQLRKIVLEKKNIILLDNYDQRWKSKDGKTTNSIYRENNRYKISVSEKSTGVKKENGFTTYFLPYEKYKIHGDLTIAGDMIIITQPGETETGVVIEHKQTAENLKILFELALPRVKEIVEEHERRKNK